jgi:hypothetical protein
MPPQQQVVQRIPQAPDSVLKSFARQLASQELLLRRADEAKVALPDSVRTQMYTQLGQLVTNLWGALGIDPKLLADSAKSTAEKERLAASRVNSYLDHMMAGEAQIITVPTPLKKMLDMKYDASTNSAGLDRALENAQRTRASADSAHAANQPKSSIPMPGNPPGARPPGTPEQP